MSAAAAAGRGRRVDDHDDLCGPAATPGGALGRGACSPCAPRCRTRANNRAGRDHNGGRSGTPDGNGRTSPPESSRPATRRAVGPSRFLTTCLRRAMPLLGRCHHHRLPRRGPGLRTWAFVFGACQRAGTATATAGLRTLLGCGPDRQNESDSRCRLHATSYDGSWEHFHRDLFDAGGLRSTEHPREGQRQCPSRTEE